MNSFGRIFRIHVYGESHGEEVGVIIDGIPAGIQLNVEDFKNDLLRRQGGNQKGTTPRKESDEPFIRSGLFNGHTTGTPLSIAFKNENTRSETYTKQRDIPRPGHADFVAHQKYKGYEDYRGGGHFSARLTVGIVAAGVVAKKVMKHLYPEKEIDIQAAIKEVGGENNIEDGIAKAIQLKDSIGGIIECTVNGLPLGVGGPFWGKTDALLAYAMMSIPAVKGIEFGAGFKAAQMTGSEHNDAIIDVEGTTATNHAGGVTGGISNGNPLVFRVVVKPTSSTPKTQHSWNSATHKTEDFSVKGRHDLCVALRAPVIIEAMTAIVLADLLLCGS